MYELGVNGRKILINGAHRTKVIIGDVVSHAKTQSRKGAYVFQHYSLF